jgi:hypothetical protein
MENLPLFITGFCIFATYLFFLLRMISKQHNIQKKTNPSGLKTEVKDNGEEQP